MRRNRRQDRFQNGHSRDRRHLNFKRQLLTTVGVGRGSRRCLFPRGAFTPFAFNFQPQLATGLLAFKPKFHFFFFFWFSSAYKSQLLLLAPEEKPENIRRKTGNKRKICENVWKKNTDGVVTDKYWKTVMHRLTINMCTISYPN